MKIEIKTKDAVKYQRIEALKVDQSVHKGLDIGILVATIKRTRPWVKIIDIRVDLR